MKTLVFEKTIALHFENVKFETNFAQPWCEGAIRSHLVFSLPGLAGHFELLLKIHDQNLKSYTYGKAYPYLGLYIGTILGLILSGRSLKKSKYSQEILI